MVRSAPLRLPGVSQLPKTTCVLGPQKMSEANTSGQTKLLSGSKYKPTTKTFFNPNIVGCTHDGGTRLLDCKVQAAPTSSIIQTQYSPQQITAAQAAKWHVARHGLHCRMLLILLSNN